MNAKKLAMLLLLHSLLLLSSSPSARGSDPLLSPKGVNYEVAALMTVKGKLRDSVGAMDGWDINSVDPCTWSMVGCSPDGFVVSLEMAGNNLGGTLSSSIGNLSHLQTMLLQNNHIMGSLPPEIGKLSQLKTLDLSGNLFIGEIPSSLGNLIYLSYLRLNRNNFSGLIPAAVANLTGLSFLDLSFNNLSGPTPKILAKDYSVAGNTFLCASSDVHGCAGHNVPLDETNTEPKTRSHHLAVNVIVSIGCTLTFAVLLIWWLHWSRGCYPLRTDGERDYEFDIGHLKRFSFRELQVATDHFNPKNIVGQGGFGVVYKGVLRNGTFVAVKRLKDPNFTGEVQFQTEVELIGLALHRNLLRLYGFCMTNSERLLIYPYMPNGSVSDRLRDQYMEKPSLDWTKRMRIALGTARGLLYLHEQCDPKIIHRDVKAANILLDEGFEAVVGDFGLAKLLDRGDSHVTTAVRGTVGHIAPEYLSTGQSSEKTDVFGFGILLLELIIGLKTTIYGNGHFQKGTFLDWVRYAEEEKRLHTLVDKDLKGSFDYAELENAVKVALQCTRFHPNSRPKMSDVVKALESGSGSMGACADGSHLVGEGSVVTLSSNYACDDVAEESSVIMEPMELSGPR